ncbi:MAG TPA: carboxylesterase family protein [Acidobacteriaceae bacterium]|nr:carboxylesterase family protein [Acidobacteriaceae bacterium]
MRSSALHRAIVSGIFLVILTLALLSARTSTAQDGKRTPLPHSVRIQNGKLQGYFTADRQVIAYKGIPYAQPPIEELRWRPPIPLGKWKGTLSAQEFGPHCLQSISYPDMVFHDPAASEDCLTLNVWTPASTAASHPAHNLPVMVWIYGGGFLSGGTSENRQDGEFLAQHGVIVVSMNYRLGIFGFFALPELTGESPTHSSGNYGLMDQAAALAWVHQNIAAFGGDPNNVTLFGQSAGSMSVSAQMASPIANTLFARAIGQSGSEFPSAGRAMPTLTQAEQADDTWATRTFGSDRLFYLRQLPAEELLEAAASRDHIAPRFGPIVDGYFLPDSVAHIFADGKQAHIPLLAGWVADEQHTTRPPTPEELTAHLQHDFGADAQQALTFYPASTPAEAIRSANDYAGDRFIAYATWAWIEAHSRTGNAPVYRYFFDLPSPGDRNHPASLGAFHSDDIEYVFGTLDSRPGITLRPEDHALSTLMQQYWINFARTGNPNGPGLQQWPVYNRAATAQTDTHPVMHLDANSAASPDTLRPRYLFLDQFWGMQTK